MATSESFSFYAGLNVFLHEQIKEATQVLKKTFSEKRNKKCHSNNQLDGKKLAFHYVL